MLVLAALIAVTAVWGVTFVQVKDAVALYPLFAFLAVRFAIATLTLAVPGTRRVRMLGRTGIGGGALLGLLLAAGYALQTAGLGRAPGHRRLRERARLPRPDLGPAAHVRDTDGPRLRDGAGLRGALRDQPGRRPPRRSRVDGLRRDHGRDRPGRARRRRCPPKGVATGLELDTMRLRFSQ